MGLTRPVAAPRRRPAVGMLLVACLGIGLGAAPGARAIAPGDLVVADEFVGLIHVDAKTGHQTPIPTTGLSLNWLAGVVIDRAGGVIVVSRNDLVRIDPETGISTELTSGGGLDDFVGRVGMGPQGEYLYTSTVNLGGGNLDGSLIEVDPGTGAQVALVSGGLLGSVWDFGFASDGDVFVENSNTVVRIDGTTSQQSFFLFTPDEDYGRLTVLPDDDLVVHERTNPGLQSSLLRVDAITSGESRIPVPLVITGVENDEDGVIYYSWCFVGPSVFCENGEVVRITPLGAHEVVYSGISPLGFAIAPTSVASVPTLSPLGLGFLTLLLAAAVLRRLGPAGRGVGASIAAQRCPGWRP